MPHLWGSVVGTLRGVALALRPSPTSVLEDPVLVESGGVRWWHVAVRLEPRLWERKERERCRAFLLVEGLGRGLERLTFAGEGEVFEPQAEIDLCGGERRMIPVVVRAMVDLALDLSPLRRWIPLALKPRRAWVTGYAALVDRVGDFDIPPGSHRLSVSIWSSDERIAIRTYLVRIPPATHGNEEFRLEAGANPTPIRSQAPGRG